MSAIRALANHEADALKLGNWKVVPRSRRGRSSNGKALYVMDHHDKAVHSLPSAFREYTQTGIGADIFDAATDVRLEIPARSHKIIRKAWVRLLFTPTAAVTCIHPSLWFERQEINPNGGSADSIYNMQDSVALWAMEALMKDPNKGDGEALGYAQDHVGNPVEYASGEQREVLIPIHAFCQLGPLLNAQVNHGSMILNYRTRPNVESGTQSTFDVDSCSILLEEVDVPDVVRRSYDNMMRSSVMAIQHLQPIRQTWLNQSLATGTRKELEINVSCVAAAIVLGIRATDTPSASAGTLTAFEPLGSDGYISLENSSGNEIYSATKVQESVVRFMQSQRWCNSAFDSTGLYMLSFSHKEPFCDVYKHGVKQGAMRFHADGSERIVLTPGSTAGVQQIDRITLGTGAASSGSVVLHLDGAQTRPIPYDSTVAVVKQYIEELEPLRRKNVRVTVSAQFDAGTTVDVTYSDGYSSPIPISGSAENLGTSTSLSAAVQTRGTARRAFPGDGNYRIDAYFLSYFDAVAENGQIKTVKHMA